MSAQHTPGPWVISGKQSIRGQCRELIAKTNWSNGVANARLIASAPEMLAALQALQRAGGIWPDLQSKVDAAIAKATGGAA